MYKRQLFNDKVLTALPSNVTNKQVGKSVSKLPYATRLRVAQWNVEDIRKPGVQHEMVAAMKHHGWDLLFISESHLAMSSHYLIDGYAFYFSSQVDSGATGVGVIIAPWLRPFVLKFVAHSSRICELEIAAQSARIRFFGVYAPTQSDELSAREAREAFWTALEDITSGIPQTTFWAVVGDFNVRLQGRLLGEEAVVGPHVHGFGHARASGQGMHSNRHHLLDYCGCLLYTSPSPRD